LKSKAPANLELRPASMADAAKVADLETARNPDEPRDSAMLHFWWSVNPPDEVFTRMIAERDGAAQAYVYTAHMPWDKNEQRFGSLRAVLHPDIWNDTLFESLLETAESWLVAEGGAIAVARARQSFERDLHVLTLRGYKEVRQARMWQLDLVAGRERLLAGAVRARQHMAEEGIVLLTLDQDEDPDRLIKLYELCIEAEQDIPTTMPIPVLAYDEWHHLWFENPGIRVDRVWIAREGEAVVGLSAIEYPPTRGNPWTALTATSRSVRGRGIARALKYETVAQAIAFGATRIGTTNDGENAPILHLNAQMGYAPTIPWLELHRELAL
jgi:GNAT superfamily N-acetyltransferase